MKLIVAEKPSVANKIASALGAQRCGPYWSGNGYMITNCLGHLCQLAEPEEYDPALRVWSLDTLPIIPNEYRYQINKNTRNQFDLVKKLMLDKQVESIINACDGDREGERIFRLVYDLVGCKKPVERLWVSSMEEDAILDGIQHLRPMSDYDHLAESADCRSKADWLIGMNYSRLYSKLYEAPLRIGRVQTPTTYRVVQREKEIQDFVPVDYFILTADFGAFQATLRCDSQEQAQEILKHGSNGTAVVSGLVNTPKREPPPQLYNLNDVQQDANKFFGATAAQTANALQQLYENQLATYPRTESRYLTEKDRTMAERALDTALSSGILPNTIKEHLYPDLKVVMHDEKVSGHPALLALGRTAAVSHQNTLEKQILTLLMFRLLEATAPERQYTSTQVELDLGGYLFNASGTIEIAAGWRQIEAVKCQHLKIRKKQAKEANLPPLHEKDRLMVKSLTVDKKHTLPPQRFTEGTLLEAMEKDGLGTPATRSQILENLIQTKKNQSGLLTRGKLIHGKWTDTKRLYPTQNAMILMDLLPEDLKSPTLTADWERQLTQICKGHGSAEQFHQSIECHVREQVKQAKQTKGNVSKPVFEFGRRQKSLCPCPICETGSIISSRFRGKGGAKIVYHCSNRNCGMRFSSPIAKRDISESELIQLCQNGLTDWLDDFVRNDGGVFSAKLKLVNENGHVAVKFAPIDEFAVCQCPICHTNPVIPFHWKKSEHELLEGWQCKDRHCILQRFYNPQYGRFFTDDEVMTLFTTGQLSVPHGMKDRHNQPFSATITLERDQNHDLTGKYRIQRK